MQNAGCEVGKPPDLDQANRRNRAAQAVRLAFRTSRGGLAPPPFEGSYGREGQFVEFVREFAEASAVCEPGLVAT